MNIKEVAVLLGIEQIIPSERIKSLMERRDKLIREKRRQAYAKSPQHLFYMWSEGTRRADAGSSPGVDVSKRVCMGDHLMRVEVDYPFPGDSVPSFLKGISWDPVNWAEDYAYVLDYSPPEIYPNEYIVGEFHWCLEEFRSVKYPSEIDDLGLKAREIGSGGEVFGHTCADLNIGLTQGWKEILDRIGVSIEKFKKSGEEQRAEYCRAAEIVCKAIIRFIKSHAQKATTLAEEEIDSDKKANYLTIAKICENISEKPPSNFREAAQFILFFMIAERILGHGNGYGRLDQLLKPFYSKDKNEGRITREEARELIAELYIKYSGSYFSLGGRDKNLKDATNEVSWIALEAYDMVNGTNTFGVLWHKDIDNDFFTYACHILAKYGGGSPALLNYDVMYKSELHYGFKKEDACNISYNGCYWYGIPGKEYCNHDMSVIILILCLMRAIDKAVDKNIANFDELWKYYCIEVESAARALRDLMDAQYRLQPLVWPEIVTSLLSHGCIENGRDITDRGVPYTISTVNIFSLANTVDSLYTIKKLVFQDKKINLFDLKKAIEANYEGYEVIRQLILNLPKYGNDIDEVDNIAIMVVNQVKNTLKKYQTIRGGFRPALYDFMNHIYAPQFIGATPDGRKREEPLSHGPNPMHGRNKSGITANARSLAKLGFEELAGGPFQLEVDPLLAEKKDLGKILNNIATSYFEMGGVQILSNIVSVETLEKAIEHPEEYANIVVRVTGISVHFINLDREIQEEIIERTRHRSI
jgi:formate C-acetyltransferase